MSSSLIFLAVGFCLFTGLMGASLGEIDAFLPPRTAGTFSITGGGSHGQELTWNTDLETALAQARTEGSLEYMRSLPVPRIVHLLADLSVWLVIVLPGVAFAIVPLFALAVALALAYELTGSLLASITMHALFNATSVAMLLYVRSHP
jgi:membrane protease YdiL (CAAX protease family)